MTIAQAFIDFNKYMLHIAYGCLPTIGFLVFYNLGHSFFYKEVMFIGFDFLIVDAQNSLKVMRVRATTFVFISQFQKISNWG